MNLKKLKIISVFGIFILSFIFHFLYQLLPNALFSIFFPVNESIFEHMKLIFSSVIFYGIIDYLFVNKFKIKTNNFFLNLFISSITCIAAFLLIWLPIYYSIGEKMIITFIVLFIAIVISQIVSFYILSSDQDNKTINIVYIICIILTYIIGAYFTYYPPKYEFFFDTKNEKYGINTYRIK